MAPQRRLKLQEVLSPYSSGNFCREISVQIPGGNGTTEEAQTTEDQEMVQTLKRWSQNIL